MRYLLLLMIAITCAAYAEKPLANAAQRAQSVADPVITRIVSRHDVIVVRAGSKGPTYSLQGSAGQTIVPATTAGQLAKSAPELSKKVQSMQADSRWAGIDTN